MDYVAVPDGVVGLPVTASLILGLVVAGLLYFEWRRFNDNFMDREIQKFFDDNETNT